MMTSEKLLEAIRFRAMAMEHTTRWMVLELARRYEAEIAEYQSAAEYQQGISVERYFEIKRLKEEIERLKARKTRVLLMARGCGKSDAVRRHLRDLSAEAVVEFVEMLCKGRIPNDPVVVAAKAELKAWKEGV